VRYANFFLPPHHAKREREQVTVASQLGRQTHTAGKLVNIYFNIFVVDYLLVYWRRIRCD